MGKANRVAGILVVCGFLFMGLDTSMPLAQEESCVFPTSPGTVVYPEDWSPIGLSSETVDRNGDVDLTVDFEGPPCPPFAWSVEGTGFTLDETSTQTGTNGLHATGLACGPAKIIVTDDCGRTATGYVRCTTGNWVCVEGCAGHADITSICQLHNCFYWMEDPGDNCFSGGGSKEIIVGKMKYHFVYPMCYGEKLEDPEPYCELTAFNWKLKPDSYSCQGLLDPFYPIPIPPLDSTLCCHPHYTNYTQPIGCVWAFCVTSEYRCP